MKKTELTYKQMHECRLHLLFGGFLTDKENEHVKNKIESYAKKNGIPTIAEKILKYLTPKL